MNGRAAWTTVAGWGTLALLALLGAGGAASAPDGLLQGMPSLGMTALTLAGVGAVAVLAGAGGAVCLGLSPLVLLLVAAPRLPGVAAMSGPPLAAAALAGVALALSSTRRPAARLAFFPLVLGTYLVVAARVQAQVGPEGDEPHYLMVTESLLRDGDLALEEDYAQGRYRAFHPGDLAPHYRVRGRDGEIYSLHAVGLSLLVLPAYALAGYAGASFFMAFLAALAAREIRGLVRAACGAGPPAEAVGWVVAFAPPLLHYAGLVFTEVPAALVVAWALRRGLEPARGLGGTLALGAAVAFLPWLNVRYAPVAVLLLLHAAWHRRDRRGVLLLLWPAVSSAVALAAYHHALYGFLDPRRVYGRRPELSLAGAPEGLQGLLLDQEFGLLVHAPVFALAVPGLVALWRCRPRTVAVGVVLVASVLLVTSSWPMWRGGWNPPGRFLLPIVPVLALGVARRIEGGMTAAAALLVGWSLFAGLAGAAEPHLVHRDRDGTAPLWRATSGAEEWTRLLPGYVLGEDDRHRLAAVWAVALVLAASRGRAATAARLAWAVLSLVFAAGLAEGISDGRTGGRDAVRVVGRSAVLWPDWRAWSRSVARWDTQVLDWGPAYEPHRHPDGAVVGARLLLRPGRYRLVLEGEAPGSGARAPALEVSPEGSAAPGQAVALVPVAGGLAAEFDVVPGARAVTLALRGGGAFVVHGVTLASTLSP
ncbi:MAG: hypothetical protein HY317_02400 [Acidobacteria bacterium]|nr:hypothetical protein [Acidobacteriota bacterium]